MESGREETQGGDEDYLTAGRGFVQWDAALHQLCKSPVCLVQRFLGFAVLVEESGLLPMLLMQPPSKETVLPTALLTALANSDVNEQSALMSAGFKKS